MARQRVIAYAEAFRYAGRRWRALLLLLLLQLLLRFFVAIGLDLGAKLGPDDAQHNDGRRLLSATEGRSRRKDEKRTIKGLSKGTRD